MPEERPGVLGSEENEDTEESLGVTSQNQQESPVSHILWLPSSSVSDNSSDASSAWCSDFADNEHVCTRCSSLDLLQYFQHGYRKHGERQAYLGTSEDLVRKRSCSVCRLLDFVKQECVRHKEDSRYAIYCDDESLDHVSFARIFLTVRCALCPKDTGQPSGKYSIVCDRLLGDTDDDAKEASAIFDTARRVEPGAVDFTAISGWFADCEEHHRPCAARLGRALFPHDLRLIDCRRRIIVQAAEDDIYATLSYVWGEKHESNDPPSRLPKGALPSALPQTIEDAMTVTRRLGLDYIWIDRYCIDQENEFERRLQIRQMDLVYQRSYVTIIAAAGHGPSYGLPGVSVRSRRTTPTAELREGQLFALRMNKLQVVRDSVWSTRGWTFQEGFFAVRRLIFTDEMLFYECRGRVADEREPGSTQNPRRIFEYEVKDRVEARDIIGLLSSYSERVTTFDEDALNAFEGVLSDYQRSHYSGSHYMGVVMMPRLWLATQTDGVRPVEQTKNNRFIAGLCWRSCSEGRRRACFPSWSWAGWTCTVEAYYSERDYGLLLDSEDVPRVWIERPDSKLIAFEDLPEMETSAGSSTGQILVLEALVIPLKLWDTTQLDDELNLLPDHSNEILVVFEDEQHVARAKASFIHRPDGKRSMGEDGLGTYAGGVFGVLLSGAPHWGISSGFFFLLVESEGQCYRRIGHLRLSLLNTRIVSKTRLGEDRRDVYWSAMPADEQRRLVLGDKAKRTTIRLA